MQGRRGKLVELLSCLGFIFGICFSTVDGSYRGFCFSTLSAVVFFVSTYFKVNVDVDKRIIEIENKISDLSSSVSFMIK